MMIALPARLILFKPVGLFVVVRIGFFDLY